MNNENILKAIADAKSQGFVDEYRTSGSSSSMPHSDIFLSPLFWQSLGKAREWESVKMEVGYEMPVRPNKILNAHDWEFHWHRFIDKLASGGTTEDFFAELV